MKKLLVALALLTVSTVGYAKEVIAVDNGIFIIDGKSVYRCSTYGCVTVSSDYRKRKSEDPYFIKLDKKTNPMNRKPIESFDGKG